MSKWVQIIGTIEVNTFASSDAESIFIAQTVVNHLPKITGSENDVEYYLTLKKGHNTSSSWDEFDVPSNLYNNSCFHRHEIQTRVLITLRGSLRDRELKETLRETTKTLNRLSSRLWVDNCLVSVRDYNKSYIFNNPDWVLENKASNWVEEKNLRINN